MKAKKILQVTNRLPWPLNDGGNLATYHVAKHLKAQGHEVLLASLNTQKHYQDPEVLSHLGKVFAVDIDTQIRLFPLIKGVFSSFPYNVGRFHSPDFEALLQEIIRKEQPDLVQLEGSYQAIFIPAIRKVAKIPVLLRSHNVEWKIWERLSQNAGNPLKKWYLGNLYPKIRRFESETLFDFDGVIAITEEDEAWYREQGYTKVLRTINAGVDLEQAQAAKDFAPPYRVGFIGSMEWQPNLEGVKWFVEKVWPLVRKENPQAEFHLAGKNPPAWMETWEVPGLTFHGMVPDAAEFIRGFHIFAVPLLSGGGMRLKVIEALAMKKCVVSTSVGAEGVRVVAGRDLKFADDPQIFAQILNDLINTPERSQEMAEQGYQTIRQGYDWRNLIREFEAVYESVL